MDYDYESYYDIRKQHEIACRYILGGLGLVGIAASIFLITTILRFKRLKTRTNMYILQLSVIKIFCIIGFMCFLAYDVIARRAMEMLILTQITFITLHVLFTFLLALDWFLTVCKPHWMDHYQKFYGYVHLVIYVLFLIEWIVGMFYASESHHSLKVLLFVIVYFFIVLLFFLLNIFRGCINVKSNALRTEYGFTVANIIIFSFLPCLFHHLVYLVCMFYDRTNVLQGLFYFITFLPYFIYIGHPVIVIFVLGYLNKYFKRAYNKSFRRVRDYSQEDMDELYLEDTVEENDIPVSFSNGKNETVNI